MGVYVTLSDIKYGFQKGKSTMEAVDAVIILRRLQGYSILASLVNLIRSYFEDREVYV